ncbi:MAG: hypothetical protein MN733_42315, partial [Nitrososphaera sp.]|nr:hypothetical protein [Nitrososphaera sp.]
MYRQRLPFNKPQAPSKENPYGYSRFVLWIKQVWETGLWHGNEKPVYVPVCDGNSISVLVPALKVYDTNKMTWEVISPEKEL